MKAYLAGPDIFLRDAKAVAARKKALCAASGIDGVFPLDNGVSNPVSRLAEGLAIGRANEAMITQCDMVLANMTPFRSPSLDPGTAFEIGFACARGKKIHGYSGSSEPFAMRTRRLLAQSDTDPYDRLGLEIEDFGMTDNLMVHSAIVESGGTIMVRASVDLAAMEAFEALLAHLIR